MAAMVSLTALMRVFSRWRGYDWIARVDAVLFALLLVAVPLLFARAFRNGKQVLVEQTLWFTYLILLMSTILART
jgi:hypothetical protein